MGPDMCKYGSLVETIAMTMTFDIPLDLVALSLHMNTRDSEAGDVINKHTCPIKNEY